MATPFRPVSTAIFYTRIMQVTVLLFASVADAAGRREVTLEARDGARVADIRDAMVQRYPGLERFVANLMYAVDEDYARPETPLHEGARVAFIPPVSGGI